MIKYIIVKYADDYYPGGKANISDSVYGTHTANKVGIQKEVYNSKEEAMPDLRKLQEVNPSVGYKILQFGFGHSLVAVDYSYLEMG